MEGLLSWRVAGEGVILGSYLLSACSFLPDKIPFISETVYVLISLFLSGENGSEVS